MKRERARPFEIRLSLELSRGELVRSFVREAALLEGARSLIASLIAEDTLHAWAVLCAVATGRESASVRVSSSLEDVECAIVVKGHARFSSLVTSLSKFVRRDAGLSVRERGIDGWELGFRRPLTEELTLSELFERGISERAAPQARAPAVPTADVQIDLPKREDAAEIARCFLDVYGRNYVHAEVFSPQRYWSKVECGELLPVVARNENGEVIGHVALEREPGAVIAERGEAVVLSAYRGRHLLEKMTERLSDEAKKLGLIGIFAVPVTIHTFSQRNDERAGMPVCAVLLGATSEGSHPKDADYPTVGQRQSNLIAFRFLTPPPERAICAPEPYRDVLRRIYESLGVEASPRAPATPAMTESKTKLSINQRAYGTIFFEQIGANAGIELKQAFRDVLGLGARAVQLSAPLGDPGLPLLVSQARDLGFFFCGVGPAFFDGSDIFMLQFLCEPLDVRKLQLYTEQAKELVSFIETDRSRQTGESRLGQN
ncbi:hypothetical protein WOC76_22430 [Methylocystis sp. IM3]|uniref:hypothetical protein n=1 Tax=unclassified Methylocystis TaxID=2625913 RepID=UPI0030F7A8EA